MRIRQGYRSAFTLLELIAAMAIGVLLLSLCLVTSGGAIRRCGEVGDGMGVAREARRATQQLAEDLSLAVREAGVLYQHEADDWKSDRMGFYCLFPKSQQSSDRAVGDLCAVMYQCKNVLAGGRSVRCLMRTVHDSMDVYQAVASGQPQAVWRQRPMVNDPVASGVVSFRVRRMIHEGNGRWREKIDEDEVLCDGFEIVLVMAEPDIQSRMMEADGSSQAGDLDWSGSLPDAERHPNLRVYRTLMILGRNEAG